MSRGFPVFLFRTDSEFHHYFGFEPDFSLPAYVAAYLDESGGSDIDLSDYGFQVSYSRRLSPITPKELKNTGYFVEEFELNGKKYGPGSPLIVGIINTTPDSFYPGGRAAAVDEAVQLAAKHVREGADILDVGGMSTRPSSEEISVKEEINRVVPVVKEIAGAFDVPVSVDTYRREVAEAALEAGAAIVNDVFGFRKPGMLELIARERIPAVLMHMKGSSPRTMQKNPYYKDIICEVAAFFRYQLERLEELGGEISKVILDPGIGFGKRYEDNLDLINHLSAFKTFGLPLLVGHSRKSFIGIAAGEPEAENRLPGTVAAGTAAVLNGASILRVHDVAEAVQSAKVAAELRRRLTG